MKTFARLGFLKPAHRAFFCLGRYDRDIEPDSGLFSFRKFFTPEIKNKKTAFTLAEIMVSILVVAIIAALMIPAFMGNANDKSLSTQYSKMEKDIISQLESLASMEGVQNFDDTSMVKKTDDNDYTDNAQAFLMKHFNVTKACTTARDCFPEGRKYKNGNGQDYNFTPDGACGHLKNGSVMCITPRYYVKDDSGAVKKDTDVKIWLDLNGKRKPNVYGEDLYIFQLKVTGQGKTKLSFEDDESNDNILDGLRLVKLTHDCKSDVLDAYCCDTDDDYFFAHEVACCKIPELSSKDYCESYSDPCATAPTAYGDACCNDPNHPEYKNLSVCKSDDCATKISRGGTDILSCCETFFSERKLDEGLGGSGEACCFNEGFRNSHPSNCIKLNPGYIDFNVTVSMDSYLNGSTNYNGPYKFVDFFINPIIQSYAKDGSAVSFYKIDRAIYGDSFSITIQDNSSARAYTDRRLGYEEASSNITESEAASYEHTRVTELKYNVQLERNFPVNGPQKKYYWIPGNPSGKSPGVNVNGDWQFDPNFFACSINYGYSSYLADTSCSCNKTSCTAKGKIKTFVNVDSYKFSR